MSCCNISFDFGCVEHCSSYDIGLLALQNGDHIIEFQFTNGSILKDTVTLAINDPIVINLTSVNEVYCHTFSIRQPDGTLYVFNDSGVDYTCFQLKSNIAISI